MMTVVRSRELSSPRAWLLAIVVGLLTQSTVLAQVTIQQPVQARFGSSSTVSVPDRGRVLLGGVNSGRTNRQHARPGGSRNFGSELVGSSQSVGVFIHDLRAMDEAIRQSAVTEYDVASDWDDLRRQRAGTQSNNPVGPWTQDPATRWEQPGVRQIPVDRSQEIQRLEKLAAAADAAGKAGVAALHRKLAARYRAEGGGRSEMDRARVPAVASDR